MERGKLKLGIIGMSEGNGHPYSWSAIINGYDKVAMKDCEFPVIPEYLSEQPFPEAFLCDEAEVTHVWTQDLELSERIARASKITNICKEITDMLGAVDAVLLARDDGENHLQMASHFLKAEMPVFIDKPFALNLEDAHAIYKMAHGSYQVFTCSSLRYAKEFDVSNLQFPASEVIELRAKTPKYWSTYATHIIEPSFCILDDWTDVNTHEVQQSEGQTRLTLTKESGRKYEFIATGNEPSSISIHLKTKDAEQELIFMDSFSAFKTSLSEFIKQVRTKKTLISPEQSLHIVECISLGMK